MKTKIVYSLIAMLMLAGIYAFKTNSSGPDSQAAILGHFKGKDNDDNFIITFSDGKMEKIPFILKQLSVEGRLEAQIKLTEIINYMQKKGYNLVSTEGGVFAPAYFFEKN